MNLNEKKCAPCEGIGAPLNSKEALSYLNNVTGWELDPSGKSITRQMTLKNFVTAINVINKISEIAESENHHPDLHITNYKNLTINLSTHAIGGLSENDFILAAKINKLL